MNSYDGTVVDRRGQESVTIEVGAGDVGFAFTPPVLKVEAGTEIVWEWTGEGGAHNVTAREQTPSDFRSGTPVAEGGTTFTYTLETEGNYFYHCEPHTAAGMHGAVIVE